MMLIIRASPFSSCGKNLAKHRYDQKDDQFGSSVTRLLIFVFTNFLVPFIKQTLWNSCLKFLVEPHYERNDDQFAKYSQTHWDHCFQEVFCWISSEWHFRLLSVKFLLNQITTHKMASLENIVTRLRIIVLCYSYCAYHQNDTLELSPWNCDLTPLWRKWWPICKILSHTLKSSFPFIYLVLIVRATLWSC